MATTPIVYVICGNNCKYEGMTKEQILSAIVQAVENGQVTDIDKGFISTVLTINNVSLKFFYGEQSAYDALPEAEKENLYAIITNDTYKNDIDFQINLIKTNVSRMQDRLRDGGFVVKSAEKATCDENGDNIVETYEKIADRKQYYKNAIIKDTDYTDSIVYKLPSMKRDASSVIGCAGRLRLYIDDAYYNCDFSGFVNNLTNNITITVPINYGTSFAYTVLNITIGDNMITLSDTTSFTVYCYASPATGFVTKNITNYNFSHVTLYYE